MNVHMNGDIDEKKKNIFVSFYYNTCYFDRRMFVNLYIYTGLKIGIPATYYVICCFTFS